MPTTPTLTSLQSPGALLGPALLAAQRTYGLLSLTAEGDGVDRHRPPHAELQKTARLSSHGVPRLTALLTWQTRICSHKKKNTSQKNWQNAYIGSICSTVYSQYMYTGSIQYYIYSQYTYTGSIEHYTYSQNYLYCMFSIINIFRNTNIWIKKSTS